MKLMRFSILHLQDRSYYKACTVKKINFNIDQMNSMYKEHVPGFISILLKRIVSLYNHV